MHRPSATPHDDRPVPASISVRTNRSHLTTAKQMHTESKQAAKAGMQPATQILRPAHTFPTLHNRNKGSADRRNGGDKIA